MPNGRDRVEVVHPLAVDRAVAGVDERRRRRVLAGVDRGRRGHDLERRARRVEALRGPVEQRRGGLAVGADLLDPAEVRLDVVRVVARRRHHHADAARARIERDDRAAVAAERVEGGALAVDVERRDDGVADDRLAVQLVERLVDERREAAGRAGQRRVHRALEPGSRAGGRRVADDVRREPALRVAAEVERASADVALLVPGEHAAEGERIRPRLISNCATRWIALSWRSASAGRAHVCQ